jgi:HTH-type transcriptional regulator / antitoxin HipB
MPLNIKANVNNSRSGNFLTPEEIGLAVRTTRKKARIRLQDLALTSGTGIRFLIDLEKGKPTCQVGKVLKVLRTLGIKVILE